MLPEVRQTIIITAVMTMPARNGFSSMPGLNGQPTRLCVKP